MDSATEQCIAKLKRSGERCQRLVIGGGPAMCMAASRRGRSGWRLRAPRRRPLGLACRISGGIRVSAVGRRPGLRCSAEHLLRKQASGELTPEESTALGLAIARATRTSKTALDAQVESRLAEIEERRVT